MEKTYFIRIFLMTFIMNDIQMYMYKFTLIKFARAHAFSFNYYYSFEKVVFLIGENKLDFIYIPMAYYNFVGYAKLYFIMCYIC